MTIRISSLLLGVSVAAFVVLLPSMILNGMTVTLLAAATAAFASLAGAIYAQKKHQADCVTLLRQLERKSNIPSRVLRVLLEAVLLGYSLFFFYLVGEQNAALLFLADIFHVDFGQLLHYTPLLLAVLAVPGAAAVLLVFQFAWSRLAGWARTNTVSRLALRTAVVFVVAALQYWSLEISSLKLLLPLFHGGVNTFFDNFCLILFAEAVLALLLGNTKRSLTLLSVLITLWSIANYYTIRFHGSPLIFSELKNAGTAMAVIGGYKFRISVQVVAPLVIGLLELFFIFVSTMHLVLMVLHAAGSLSPLFYSEILALSEVLPVRMSNGIVMDKDGNTFVYPEDTFAAREQLKQYYYMEYISLLPEDEYRKELFMPPVYNQ